jgi:hypothetical protein
MSNMGKNNRLDIYTGECVHCHHKDNILELIEKNGDTDEYKWGCPKCYETFTTIGRDNIGHWDDLLTDKEKAFMNPKEVHIKGNIETLTPEEVKKMVESTMKIWEDHFGSFKIGVEAKDRTCHIDLNLRR